MAKETQKPAYDIASVKDAIKLMKEIAYHGYPMGIHELAKGTNLNPNKVFRILKTLVGEGMIEKHGEKYGIGYGLAEMYARYLRILKKVRDNADLKLANLEVEVEAGE